MKSTLFSRIIFATLVLALTTSVFAASDYREGHRRVAESIVRTGKRARGFVPTEAGQR